MPIPRKPAGRIAGGTASLLSSRATHLRVKGGLLSIATQELLLALQPSPLALTMARDLAYQRQLSSLKGQDLRTQSTKKNMEGRGRPAQAWPSYTTATDVRVRHDSRSRPRTAKISSRSGTTILYGTRPSLIPFAALLRQHFLPFPS